MMSADPAGRFVHAEGVVRFSGRHGEVVRYEADGAWCLEFERGSMIPYRRLSLNDAVRCAADLVRRGGTVHFGLPHGRRFDAAVRRELAVEVHD